MLHTVQWPVNYNTLALVEYSSSASSSLSAALSSSAAAGWVLSPREDTVSMSRVRFESSGLEAKALEGGLSENEDATDGHSGGETALFTAVSRMDIKAIEDAIKHGADVNYTNAHIKYRSTLHELVLSYLHGDHFDITHGKLHLKFIDILTLLTHHGLDVNSVDINRRTALHLVCASNGGNSSIVKVLLASGVGANLADNVQQTALHKAVLKGTLRTVETLLDGGADANLLDCTGHSPLHLAAKRKHNSDIIRLLLRTGANVNIREKRRGHEGSTPLHVAVKAGYVDNVRTLLTGGANVDLVDGSGQAAIHLAAAHEITGVIIQILHSKGASINDQDSVYKETPLHKAVKYDMIENFKYLVSKKANPNMLDDQNETVLHKAAGCTKPFTWMHLMRLGGDVTIRNRNGLTPMDKAQKAKNNLAVSMMRQNVVPPTHRHSWFM